MCLSILRPVVAFFVAVCAALPGAAQDLKERGIGVVLMHGKENDPNSQWLYSLNHALNRAGVLVEKPEMPWSQGRRYDASYQDAMKEIDQAVGKLKAGGARHIVVGGHSFGANASLGYAARRDGLAGIFALAPGHRPESRHFRNVLGADVARARMLVAEGKGDETTTFGDYNHGDRFAIVRATPKVYLSHFDPEGPAVMGRNAARIKPGLPVLWVIGDQDPLFANGKRIFDRIPPHPKNRYAEVQGGHSDTPGTSIPIMLEWLKTITAQ